MLKHYVKIALEKSFAFRFCGKVKLLKVILVGEERNY
jgi:hypothetical protein